MLNTRVRDLFSHPLIFTHSTVVDYEAHNDATAVELDYSLQNRGNDDFTFIGSCCGLIFFSFDPDTVLLFNPCAKESMIIPKVQSECAFAKCLSDCCVRGFGYDHSADDYKDTAEWSYSLGCQQAEGLRVSHY